MIPMSNTRHPSSSRARSQGDGRARPPSSAPSLIASGLPLTPDDRHVDLLSTAGTDEEDTPSFEYEDDESSVQAGTSIASSAQSVSSATRHGPGSQAGGGLESLHEEAAFVPPTISSQQKIKPRPTGATGRPNRGGSGNIEDDPAIEGTTLVQAALEGDVPAVEAALARGAKVRDRDIDGRDSILATVLGADKARLLDPGFSAAPPPSNHFQILSSLLLPSSTVTLYPLNVPQPSIRSATVLGLSCYLGKTAFVEALLAERGWAAEHGVGGSIRRKRKNGKGLGRGWVSVDGKDGKDGTGLMYAARDGHLEIARTLLAHGARPDATESNGQSAVQYALGRPQMVWLFEEQLRHWRAGKGKPSAMDHPFPNMSTLAALSHALNPSLPPRRLAPPLAAFPPSLSDLSSAPGSPTFHGLADHTKLVNKAIRHGEAEVLRALLFPPAPFSEREVADLEREPEPLFEQISDVGEGEDEGGQVVVVHRDASGRRGRLSLVNAVDNNGLSPLHHAMRVQPVPSLEVVKLLFFAGADVNLACSMGSSPLHQVACLGGADPVISRRRSAAAEGGNDEAVRTRHSSSTSSQTLRQHDAIPIGRSILSPVYEHSSEESSVSTDSASSVADAFLSRQGAAARNARTQLIPSWEGATLTVLAESTSIERGGMASEDTEAQLAELIRVFVWELGGDPDLKDSAGALPLHFAAQYGCSREIVRLLLQHDLETEDKISAQQAASPSSSPNLERLPAREQRNAAGLTPAEVARTEFTDLFAAAEEDAATRRTTAPGRARSPPSRPLEAGAKWASESSRSGSRMSRTPSGGGYNRQRESILQPLPPLSNLEESEAMISQVVLNMGFVDESLSSGLIASIKDSLARQNSTHPGWPERELFLTSSDDGRSESIKRLRYSFQHGQGSAGGRNSSGNRFRAYSSSTGSSWWSEPRDVYSHNQIERLRKDLDHSFHIFTHSAQMVARVLDFYSSALSGMEDTLRSYEDEVGSGLRVVGLIDARIKSLRGREDTLRDDLDQLAVTRAERTFDGQIEGVISSILSSFSSHITALLQSPDVRGRALIQEISHETDEARDAFLSLKADLEDFEHPREGDTAPLVGRINSAYRTIQDAKTQLIAAAVAPQITSPATRATMRPGVESDDRASDTERVVRHLRQQRSLSLNSGSLPPSPSSPFATFHIQQASTSTSSHSRNSSSGSEQTSSTETDATEVDTDSALAPTWASWPRRKEHIAEYAAAQMNLQEIENDLRDVEEKIEATHTHEQELTQFMASMSISTPTSSTSAASSESTKCRTEAFRLMSVILQRRLALQTHRSDLETEHASVNAVLERYDDAEDGWNNETRLAAYLHGRLEEIYAPGCGKRFDGEVCWEEEAPSGVSYGAGEKDAVEGLEGGRGWLDLKEEEEGVARELEILDGMLEGSEELCERIEKDFGLILKEPIDKTRKRCTAAARELSKAKQSLSAILQARLDELVTLWEYVSAEASDSSAASTTSSSTFYLDIRSQIGLPPSLLTDPLPHNNAPPNAQTTTGGRPLSGSTIASSLGSLAQHFPSPPHSAKGSGGGGSGSSSGSGEQGGQEVGKAQTVLKSRVHGPLEVGKREVEEAARWIGVVKTVMGELEERLKG